MRLLPDRAVLRDLIRLAAPIVTVQVGIMFMGVVDTVMVGHISATALAAVALGNIFFFALGIFGMGVLLALDPLVSQAVGAGDQAAISRAVQRGFILAGVLGVLVALPFPVAEPLLLALGQPADVVDIAASYVIILTPSMLAVLAFTVARQTLQAMGRVAPIIWSIVAANLANVVGNYALIYGKFGAPALGVEGSAWATTLSRWAMLFFLLVVAWPQLSEHLQPRRDALRLRPMLRMLKIGVPVGASMFIEYANFAAIALLMGLLGTAEIAAHQVAINIASLTFMVPNGIGAAGAVLVGNAIGRGDSDGARDGVRAALSSGVAFMCFTALIMLLIPGLLASVYTTDDAVLRIAVLLLPIAGVFQVADGIQVVGAGVLRGAGDTRVPMVISLAGFWLVGMPTSIYFGLYTPARAVGLWWGLVAGLAAVAAFLLLRIRWRFAGRLERIIVDDHHHVVELETGA